MATKKSLSEVLDDLRALKEIRDKFGIEACEETLNDIEKGISVTKRLEELEEDEVRKNDEKEPEFDFATIAEDDIEVLCETGRYSLSQDFEDYVNLSSKTFKSIKKIRAKFGKDAPIILGYIIGLIEGKFDGCVDEFDSRTIPYGDLDIQIWCEEENGRYPVTIAWPK